LPHADPPALGALGRPARQRARLRRDKHPAGTCDLVAVASAPVARRHRAEDL